jgi:hypothetical protein
MQPSARRGDVRMERKMARGIETGSRVAPLVPVELLEVRER